MQSEALRSWLDAVEGNLSGPRSGDILREIESHVWDRAEALAAARGAAEPGEEDLRAALAEMGDPSDLAVSYSGERHLVTPKEYAAFWYFTLLVFAVHLSTLLLAALSRTEFEFFPFNVLPASKMQGGGAALVLVSLAVQAFLFDAGLVVMVFFVLRKSFRRVDLPNLTFRVESSTRPSVVRAVFAAVLAVLLSVPAVRDTLFSVRVDTQPPVDVPMVYSLFLPDWGRVLPFVLVFLALSFVKDLLYAILHERTFTVALDAAVALLGTALFLSLASRDPFLGLPGDFPLDGEVLRLFNGILGRVVSLACLVVTAVFAARAVRRLARLRQVWGGGGPTGHGEGPAGRGGAKG
ncbi:MAG: hypothetical protein L6R43_16025 [Planctomycetes bacterium]|nr:hypothetical protein [Planctomycetota bacterium]